MRVRVLLVDDSAAFIVAATRLLEREGLEVVATAATGAEALEKAIEFSPDVSLVDIDLGGQSGFAVVRSLHESAKGPFRTVLISSHSRDDFADLVAESPAAGFVSKSRLSAAAIHEILDGGSSDTPHT
jgi:two-component system, NarL family, nitrate/nitrite response regulator NarL